MSKTLITVVIPLKDRLELLKETILSLESQTLKEWRVILVDDGSNDTTKCYLKDLSSSDMRFKVLENKTMHSGPNVCRNLGINASETKYVMFLDSDDLLAPHSLHRRVSVMNNNKDLDFAIFPSRVFYDDASDTYPWFKDWNGISDLDRLLKMDWPMTISSPIWKKRFLLETDLFDETLISWDDWEMHVRVLCRNPKYIRFCDDADFFYRQEKNSTNLSHIQFRNTLHLENASNVFSKAANILKENSLLTSERAHYLSEQFFGTAYLSLGIDGVFVAIKRLTKAKTLIPKLSMLVYYKNILRLVYCYIKIGIKRLLLGKH